MKTATLILLGLLTSGLHDQAEAADRDLRSDYHLCVPSRADPSLERFQRANAETDHYLVRHPPLRPDGLPALNTKCMIAPQRTGYSVIWIWASIEQRPDEATIKKVESIISAALFGPESKEVQEGEPGELCDAKPSHDSC